MNQGGRESQKNMAVGQIQYPGEAVGTRNTCKTKDKKTTKEKEEQRKGYLWQIMRNMAEFIKMHVFIKVCFKVGECINNDLILFEQYYYTENFT